MMGFSRIICFLFFACIFSASDAQTLFNKNYDGQNWTYGGESIIALDDESIVISSTSAVVKTDSTGHFIWAKYYGYDLNKVIKGKDNCIYAGGNYNYDVAFSKIDTAGNLIWTKIFNLSDSTTDNDDLIGGVINNDGTITLGINITYYSQGNPDSSKIALVKVDTSGNIIWTKIYFEPMFVDMYMNSMTYGVDSTYLITGSVNNIGAGGYDAMILKIDTGSNMISAIKFGTSTDDRAYSILPHDNKIFISSFNDNGISPFYSLPFIVQFDSSFNLEWSKLYDWSCNQLIFSPITIAKTIDGYVFNNGSAILIADSLGQPTYRGGINSPPLNGFFFSCLMHRNNFFYTGGENVTFDFLTIAKTDSSGYFDGCSYDSVPFPCVSNLPLTVGSFICLGQNISVDSDSLNYQYDWPLPMEILKCSDPVNIIENEINESQIVFYPNPTEGIINFKVTNYVSETITVTLNNIEGKLIFKKVIKEQSLDLRELNLNGMYFLSITADKLNYHSKILFNHY